ncbi:zinc-binding dehydrogenase [Streptomyces canus]|uniref:zinc-binding dehydrogenase n=1 Tax=Streptomyces canus TaxID=58343 RepID=UPI0038191BA0
MSPRPVQGLVPPPSSWRSISVRAWPRPRARPRPTWRRTSARTPSSTTRSRHSRRPCTGYDVVIDTVGGETLDKSLWVLKPDGTVISITGPPDPTFARSPPDTSAPYAPGCTTWPPRPAPRTRHARPKPPGVARIPISTAAQKKRLRSPTHLT